MKVTLVNPPGGYIASRWEKSALPPLGIGYLAAYLERHGIECEILDAYILGSKLSDVRSYLQESKPDIVGVTFTTENRFVAFDTIRLAKDTLPNALVIAGGNHVSMAPDDTLNHVPELDIIVRGEGENPLLDIVKSTAAGEQLDDIPGISFRRDGVVVNNDLGEYIPDLDSLPFPARHLMPMDMYQHMVDASGVGKLRSLNIMASRGCPFACSFCASSRMWGGRYRARSPENVLEEVDELTNRYGAESLWIFDDTFTVQRERTVAICEGLASRFPNLKWTCEIRVDTVDKELLALMKRAGCYCAAFGVESGSQRIIEQSIGKGIELDQVRQVVSWCKELNLEYNPFMILSHPDETEADARETMHLIKEWERDGARVSLAIMHIYPGTQVEAVAREKGILPKDFSWGSEADIRRVPMLPAAQGHVPIYLEGLSWDFLSDCLFEWAQMQRYSVLKRIPKALMSIRSLSDARRYAAMFKVYLSRSLLGRTSFGHDESQ